MDADLSERVTAACRNVFEGTGVFLAYAYGSRVWGTASAGSDLDVGYYTLTRAPLDPATEMGLAGRIAEELELDVDLRCLDEAPLGLRGRALEEGARLYCTDEVARVNLERDLLGRYHDYKPKLAALRELRLRALAERD